MTVEAVLGAKLDEHPGYGRHDPAGRGPGNSHNGTSSKRLKGAHGECTWCELAEVRVLERLQGRYDRSEGGLSGACRGAAQACSGALCRAVG